MNDIYMIIAQWEDEREGNIQKEAVRGYGFFFNREKAQEFCDRRNEEEGESMYSVGRIYRNSVDK